MNILKSLLDEESPPLLSKNKGEEITQLSYLIFMWLLAFLLSPHIPWGFTFDGRAEAAASGQRKRDSVVKKKKITCPCGGVFVGLGFFMPEDMCVRRW